MLYSTCTFSSLEDEESIKYLLDNCPDMKLVDIKPYEGFTKGFTDNDNDNKYNLDKCVRIFPHKMHGEGHFVALLKRIIQMTLIMHIIQEDHLILKFQMS